MSELDKALSLRHHLTPGATPEDQARLAEILTVLAQRRLDSLALFRPLPSAIPAVTCAAKWQLFDGSNQAAKTIHAAYKLGLILTGKDPSGRMPKNEGRAVFVGYDGDHLANPIYSKIFKEGAFDLIRDERTRLWRSVRPDPCNPSLLDPYDLAYKEKWRPAPPFVPTGKNDTAWEAAGKEIPRRTRIPSTGWDILWRSSKGKPPRGIQIHLGHLDEEIDNSHIWIPELEPRGIRYSAMYLWSACPQSGGVALYDLRRRADSGDQDVKSFTFLLEDNPYMSPADKLSFYNAMSPDERSVRYFGNYAIAGKLVYTDYDPMGLHGVEPFVVPDNWTRFVVLDPGRQHCGTLFLAVDPDEQYAYVYDGFDLRHGDASLWADRVSERQGEFKFEAFIIDYRMGQTRPIGVPGEKSVAAYYYEALKQRGIEPRTRDLNSGFFRANDNIMAREEALLDWMRVRGSGPFEGTAKLKVFRGAIPQLDDQIRRAQMDSKNIDKRLKLEEDLLVCLEYGAAFNPYYHEPEPVKSPTRNSFSERWKRKQASMKRSTSEKSYVYR